MKTVFRSAPENLDNLDFFRLSGFSVLAEKKLSLDLESTPQKHLLTKKYFIICIKYRTEDHHVCTSSTVLHLLQQ